MKYEMKNMTLVLQKSYIQITVKYMYAEFLKADVHSANVSHAADSIHW